MKRWSDDWKFYWEREKINNFKDVVVLHWYRRFYNRCLRNLSNNERGAYLKGTMLDEPDLDGWDRKLRKK